MITGDQYVGPEAAPFCPGLVHVPVKESVSRHAARHLHPDAARNAIGTAVQDGLSALAELQPPNISLPATLEVDLANPDMAEQATWLRGVSRVDSRTVSVTDNDPLRLFGTFVTLVYLTRSLVEAH